MQMPTLTEIVFYGAGGLAVFAAIMVVLMRDAVRSALFLVLSLFATAVLYILLKAQFIAAVQVIVYAGAIMVLFMFVIMLLNSGQTDETKLRGVPIKAVGFLVAMIVMLQLGALVITITSTSGMHMMPVPMTEDMVLKAGHTQMIGKALFSKYIYPFEAVSVLLLMAIMGSVVLAKRKL